VRYALTAAAQIKLSIKPPRGRTLVVATARGRAGLDKITWNRKLKRKHAPHGRYKLIVTATVGKRSVQSTLTVRI